MPESRRSRTFSALNNDGWTEQIGTAGRNGTSDRCTRAVLGRYLLLGLGLSLIDQRWELFSERATDVLDVMGSLGLIVLLFRVGLESNLRGLLAQLTTAVPVWLGNIALSGIVAYVAARYLLDFEIVTSVIVATALTATSVGVSVGIWESLGLIKTTKGQLLVDVAELDDITGIVFMAVLFAILPSVHDGESVAWATILGATLGWVLIKLAMFAAGCVLFSVYAEERVTRWIRRLEPVRAPTLLMVGVGILVAATAELLGLSLAIGAFFAGLVFSRDPQAIRLETSFEEIYELFAPFFFVAVGFQVNATNLFPLLPTVGLLLVAAVVGKVIGTVLPAWPKLGLASSALLGISMVPRAEIAMVIMQRGSELGTWAVPASVFSAMVLVSAGTCLLTPMVLPPLLRHWARNEMRVGTRFAEECRE